MQPAAAQPVPSLRLLDMALGLVLGLVAGIGAAAVLETIRPTVASAGGVAAAVGAPLLFDLSASRGLPSAERMDRLSAAVRLAMNGARRNDSVSMLCSYFTLANAFTSRLTS